MTESNLKDFKIDTFRQSRFITDIKVTHIPSGYTKTYNSNKVTLKDRDVLIEEINRELEPNREVIGK